MNEDDLLAAAAALDLAIPVQSLPAALAHLQRCEAAARLVMEFPLPPEIEHPAS